MEGYAFSGGKLSEDYYELRDDEWVRLKEKPDMNQDFRGGHEDEPRVNDRSGYVETIPDFVEPICSNPTDTTLFKKILADPLNKKSADTFDRTVNSKVAKEAKKQKFEGDATLPVSHIREIVMTCANMQHSMEKIKAMPDNGAGLRDEDGKPLPDCSAMKDTWTNEFNNLMDNRGYPSLWKGFFGEAVAALAIRRGDSEPFTNAEIEEVCSQHGKSSQETKLSKDRNQASKVLAIGRAATLENQNDSTTVGSSTNTVLGKRKPSVHLLEGNSNKVAVVAQDEPSRNEDISMADVGETNTHQPNEDVHMADADQPERPDAAADQEVSIERMSPGSTDEDDTILPGEMDWYNAKWEEATPLVESIFDKPALAFQEPGKQLAKLNDDIKARLSHDDEQSTHAKINVDMEIPFMETLRVTILGTDALVASGHSKASEIEDMTARSARETLLSRLKRAQQPSVWYDCVNTLMNVKAKRWREHVTAGTEPREDENLWSDDLKELVMGAAGQSGQSCGAAVFADAQNQTGQIGGFRVASKKRDGTETYQVLVQKGIYTSKDGQTTLWHIRPASMYRAELVREYKENQGVEITSPDTSSDQGKQKLQNLRQYKLADIKISGIAVIPRTQGEGFTKMPTMFIQASVEDGVGARFWSRSYMNKVWGPAATRAIRDRINAAQIPVLTNDPTKPNLFMPENASKRTCTLWGVEYTGPKNANDRGEDITGEDDGRLEPNDGVYESDDGFVVPDTEKAIDPRSKEFVTEDMLRRIEEQRVRIAELEPTTKDQASVV